MKRALLASVGLAFALGGCGHAIATLTPVSAMPGDLVYVRGSPMLMSVAENTRAGLVPPTRLGGRPVFQIVIRNQGPEPVTVGPEDVRATTDSGHVLRVVTAEQLQREAEHAATWTRVGAALAAAGNSLSAANAGYTSSTGTVSGSYRGQTGYGAPSSGTYSGTYTAQGYDAGAAAQAQANANAENRRLAADANARAEQILSNAQAGAMLRQTIFPGSTYVTDVTFDPIPGEATALTIELSAGGEVHTFRWTYLVTRRGRQINGK